MEKPDQDSGSNRNHSPVQPDFSVPPAAVEAKTDSSNESEMKKKHSHPVLDSQDRIEEDLPSQPQTPPSGLTEARMQNFTPPSQKLPVNRNQESPSKQRHCSCKVSRCLKMYCECYASGSYCNGCDCLNCHNILEKESARREAIKATLERNPYAFKPKIAGSPRGLNALQEDARQVVMLGKHCRGCNCKRSGCLKKYCECYQANVRCSDKCKCVDCKNVEGREEIQQTTSAAVKRAIDMSCYLHPPESHSVPARGSSAVPQQTVDYVVRNGDTSLFSIPDNKAVSGSITSSTYRSSLSNTMQLLHVKDLCSLLVSKSVEVANKFSDAKQNEEDSSLGPGQRDANVINDSRDCVLGAVGIDEKTMSSATWGMMCDDEHVNISEKETSARVGTSEQAKEDKDTSSEIFLEQERQILSSFKEHLVQLLNRGSINGRNIQKANTDPSRKEPEDEEQSHRDSSFGA